MVAKHKPTLLPGTYTIEPIPLQELHLDEENPRFAGHTDKGTDETELLDFIVETFGVDDVLASISVNGYFQSEPLIGVRRSKGGIRIVEGNRRLAACLILANDPRAKNQQKRGEAARKLNQDRVAAVPVMLIDNEKERDRMLAYLGVRHIVGAKPWDSYAKARWLADVLKGDDALDLDQVMAMLGDEQSQVPRVLEGYYLVTQLEKEDRFDPKDGFQQGRGSNVDYPFSWIYTALGYKGVRQFLGLPDKRTPKPNPLTDKKLDEGEEFLRLLFGSQRKNQPPAITESREIKDLSDVICDPKARSFLNIGRKRLSDVVSMRKPPAEKILAALLQANQSLGLAWEYIGEGVPRSQIRTEEWPAARNAAREAKALSQRVHAGLEEAESGKD